MTAADANSPDSVRSCVTVPGREDKCSGADAGETVVAAMEAATGGRSAVGGADRPDVAGAITLRPDVGGECEATSAARAPLLPPERGSGSGRSGSDRAVAASGVGTGAAVQAPTNVACGDDGE